MGFKKSKNCGVGALVACLERGGTVATEVYDPEKSKAAGPVYLQAGDHECSGCGTLIDTDEFPGANWANILANQRLKYGHTMCRECHQEVQDCG